MILSSKLIGGLQKKSISTDIVETPAIRLYLQNESNIELLLYYFYTLIANDESSLLSPRNERTLLSVIGILVPFIGIDEFLKIISKTWHNDHHFFEKPKTHFDFVCYLFKLIGLLKFSWILQCHTNPITPKNSCKNRISGLILILYQMCASRWMSIIIQ